MEPTHDLPGRYFNKGHNAAWLSVEWVNGDHDMQDVVALADDLAQRQIKYVFVFVSYMKPSGVFNPTYSHATEFVRELKVANPNLNVQAWIGLPLQNPSGNGYVELENAATRQKIVSFCVEMLHEFGFDGIHLDPEPVVNGDSRILMLLDELRREIGDNATISIATRRIWPFQSRTQSKIIAKFTWQADYYRKIAQHVDQVVVMTYDSGLPLPSLYRQWVNMQVVRLSQAVDHLQVELLVGVPASEEQTITHWPYAENITSGLQGIIDGLNDPSARPSAVNGVAIYPYWEVDANEWASYESLWLNR